MMSCEQSLCFLAVFITTGAFDTVDPSQRPQRSIFAFLASGGTLVRVLAGLLA